jgi:septal ring factor EnvC (AmiA/AmiB activator)
MRARSWLCWLVAALALSLPAAAEDDAIGELEVLRRAIEQHRERVGAYEREERGLLETLESMDRAAEALADDAARARAAARSARARLAELDAEIRELEDRLARTRRALGARAVALYKTGEVGPVRALFSADSLPDALARVEALRRLVVHDQDLLDRSRREAAALADVRGSAAQVAARRDEAARRTAQREGELVRERDARRALLREVRGDRTRTREALIELEAAAAALEETLAHLEETPRRRRLPSSAVRFATLRGRLPAPVDAAIVSRFGRVVDAEFQTETLRKGVEFAAESGTPVLAVAPGEVRFTGWFRGYGKIVILDHSDRYFTVCGHLDEVDVEVGAAVGAGDRIGSVGETGSLTGPKLYFEIRQGGEAVDPADWLGQPGTG